MNRLIVAVLIVLLASVASWAQETTDVTCSMGEDCSIDSTSIVTGIYYDADVNSWTYDVRCETARYVVVHGTSYKNLVACFDDIDSINAWAKSESPSTIHGVFRRDKALSLKKHVTEVQKITTEEVVEWEVIDE